MAKILIADDSLLIRETIKSILIEAGHTIVSEAGNGYEACQEFDKHQPDLVTLDINMPFMNGIEALNTIISKHPYAKIIMISSESSSSLISHALNIGAKDYLIKPFCIQGFINTVNNVLQCCNEINSDSLQRIYSKINIL
jgi:two-component system chemotaxis response regulator CheY